MNVKYVISYIEYSSAANYTIINIDKNASPSGNGNGFDYSSGTKTGVTMTGSAIHITGNVPDIHTSGNNPLAYSSVYKTLALKYFDNSVDFANSSDASSENIAIETKDYDFDMPGVYKNAYSINVSLKGYGYIQLQYAINGSDNWSDMSLSYDNPQTGTTASYGVLHLSSDSWDVYSFHFGVHQNPDLNYFENEDAVAIESEHDYSMLDNSLKDFKTIRFRIVNADPSYIPVNASNEIYGFGLNDITLVYRIKGVY
jgi:hypothetical protein